MKYENLKFTSKQEALNILNDNDTEELLLLPLSLGEYCSDWKFAQEICFKLANHINQNIRANAILGLSYIARNHLCLDKKQVYPVIYNVLKTKLSTNNLNRVIEAADDIHIFMKWKFSIKYIIFKVLLKLDYKLMGNKDNIID